MKTEIVRGKGLGEGVAKGVARVLLTSAEIEEKLRKGDILVTASLGEEAVPAVAARACGIVAEEGEAESFTAFVHVLSAIPVILGADRATDVLSDGVLITLDPASGAVYEGDVEL